MKECLPEPPEFGAPTPVALEVAASPAPADGGFDPDQYLWGV